MSPLFRSPHVADACGPNTAQATAMRRAIPAGGARKRGRDCAHIAPLLLALLAAPVAQAQTASVFDEPVAMESGLAVTFHDMVRDAQGDGLTYRFRFVVPQIGAGLGYMDVSDDMQRLCSDFALKRVSETGPQPNRIVISLMSEPTEFGIANPDVTQFFESYSVENDLCIWEAF